MRSIIVDLRKREDYDGFLASRPVKHGRCHACGEPYTETANCDGVECMVCHRSAESPQWLMDRVYKEAMAARLRRVDFETWFVTLTLAAKTALLRECTLRLAVERDERFRPFNHRRVRTALWVEDAVRRRGGNLRYFRY